MPQNLFSFLSDRNHRGSSCCHRRHYSSGNPQSYRSRIPCLSCFSGICALIILRVVLRIRILAVVHILYTVIRLSVISCRIFSVRPLAAVRLILISARRRLLFFCRKDLGAVAYSQTVALRVMGNKSTALI